MKVTVLSEKDFLNEAYIGGPYATGMDTLMGPTQFNVQGSCLTPQYALLPITDELQQKPNHVEDMMYIHPGSLVRGVGYNNKNKHFTGWVVRIVKGEDGSVLCIYIRTKKSCKHVCISPDDIELLVNQPPQQAGEVRIEDSGNVQKKF